MKFSKWSKYFSPGIIFMNHKNNFRRNNDQATTLWSLIDAAPSPPPLTPPLINFLKFFNPGHSYSNLSCQLNFQFFFHPGHSHV